MVDLMFSVLITNITTTTTTTTTNDRRKLLEVMGMFMA